jgi:acid phosphatase
MNKKHTLVLSSLLVAACGGNGGTPTPAPTGINKIDHVVVIYLENHSFDNLYGQFSGAEGLTQAKAAQGSASDTTTQIDPSTGAAYAALPQPINTSTKMPDARFPANLPNAPFDITQYVTYDMTTGDLVHRYYQEQVEMDGGKMDKYAFVEDAKGLTMGYYPTAQLPMAALAQQFTLCDHFFHSAFGGSFMNHIYLVSANVAVFPNAPSKMVAVLSSDGSVKTDGAVTPDGHVVNTSFTVNAPHPASADPTTLVPNQTFTTIGDELSAANVTWAWYSGGWNDALAGNPDPNFQFHHQPFAFFANYADGTPAKAQHLKDQKDFMTSLAGADLPAVSFVKPIGEENEHPGYAVLKTGEQATVALINSIMASKYWSSTAIIVTYDEHGGFWDHVAPPTGDQWGPGSRVPTIIISPYAKKGYVDKTPYETVSILAFLEKRFGLPALGSRDAAAKDMTNAFDFAQ